MGGAGEQEARVWAMAADRQGGGREAASGETAGGETAGGEIASSGVGG